MSHQGEGKLLVRFLLNLPMSATKVLGIFHSKYCQVVSANNRCSTYQYATHLYFHITCVLLLSLSLKASDPSLLTGPSLFIVSFKNIFIYILNKAFFIWSVYAHKSKDSKLRSTHWLIVCCIISTCVCMSWAFSCGFLDFSCCTWIEYKELLLLLFLFLTLAFCTNILSTLEKAPYAA